MIFLRKNVLNNIEGILSRITEVPQSISEDMVLYGMAENKLDVCSLELASWFVEIETEYDIEIPIDTLKVADIVDRVIEKLGEKK